MTCESGETETTVLQGFTLTGGDSDWGGGMHNEDFSPTVTNCTFSGTTAYTNIGGDSSYGGKMNKYFVGNGLSPQ